MSSCQLAHGQVFPLPGVEGEASLSSHHLQAQLCDTPVPSERAVASPGHLCAPLFPSLGGGVVGGRGK